MENTKTVLKNEIHIAGTVVSMRMEERGNCILVIRSNAERQIRNIQLRFYDINQAIIFRVGDHVRIAGHMQNRRTQDAEGNYHSTPTIVGDSIAVSKRRLTQILDESIPEQGGGAQADENWGVLAGIVTSIRTPTDKVTFLNIRIPSGRRDYNCRVTCLGRFQRAAANLKEGENVAVSCYVSEQGHPVIFYECDNGSIREHLQFKGKEIFLNDDVLHLKADAIRNIRKLNF